MSQPHFYVEYVEANKPLAEEGSHSIRLGDATMAPKDHDMASEDHDYITSQQLMPYYAP